MTRALHKQKKSFEKTSREVRRVPFDHDREPSTFISIGEVTANLVPEWEQMRHERARED